MMNTMKIKMYILINLFLNIRQYNELKIYIIFLVFNILIYYKVNLFKKIMISSICNIIIKLNRTIFYLF